MNDAFFVSGQRQRRAIIRSLGQRPRIDGSQRGSAESAIQSERSLNARLQRSFKRPHEFLGRCPRLK
jgi:hypothetical protein